jgi:hypothetical protein
MLRENKECTWNTRGKFEMNELITWARRFIVSQVSKYDSWLGIRKERKMEDKYY